MPKCVNILPARSLSQSFASYSTKAYSMATLPKASSVAVPCSQVRSAATRKRGAGVMFRTRSKRSASSEPLGSPVPSSSRSFSNSRLEYPLMVMRSESWACAGGAQRRAAAARAGSEGFIAFLPFLPDDRDGLHAGRQRRLRGDVADGSLGPAHVFDDRGIGAPHRRRDVAPGEGLLQPVLLELARGLAQDVAGEALPHRRREGLV